MKTIGIIGGITWHSTLEYYRLVNQLVNDRLGGVSSAKIVLASLDFAEIKTWTESGDWEKISATVCDAAKKLEAAGAQCLLIGANTMHKIAGEVQAAVQVPLIHIADVAANAIRQKGLSRVLLLGTKYTMELDFYKDKLAAAGIQTMIPDEPARISINSTIYEEMGKGIFLPERKAEFMQIIQHFADAGAQGVILGCTEIPVLLQGISKPIPEFDTMLLHATAAVDFAVS